MHTKEVEGRLEAAGGDIALKFWGDILAIGSLFSYPGIICPLRFVRTVAAWIANCCFLGSGQRGGAIESVPCTEQAGSPQLGACPEALSRLFGCKRCLDAGYVRFETQKREDEADIQCCPSVPRDFMTNHEFLQFGWSKQLEILFDLPAVWESEH